MDRNTINEIVTKGTYYCPAINKYLLNNKEQEVTCMVCNNIDNISYYKILYQNKDLILCDVCRITYKFSIICDVCKKKDLLASINYENNDICLKCADEFIQNYHKRIPEYVVVITDENSNVTQKIIIESACYLTDPCQHKVSINNITSMMSAPDIIRLLQMNNLEIPEHFNTKDNKKYLEYKDQYYDIWG
jgi:hypothetical protein